MCMGSNILMNMVEFKGLIGIVTTYLLPWLSWGGKHTQIMSSLNTMFALETHSCYLR